MSTPLLATTTRPWASLPLERSLQGVVRSGFSAVALPVHGVSDPLTGDLTADEVDRIGELVAAHDLDLVILSHEAALDRDDDAALAVLTRQIEHCVRLGVSQLVDMGCQKPLQYERYLRLMRQAAPRAADHGVTLAMKTHGGLSRTLDDARRTVEQVDHAAFRICLDTGMVIHHAGDAGLTDLERIAPWVASVGVRDHPGRGQGMAARRDPGHDAPGLPPAVTPGDGIVDFASLYEVLRRHDFDGPSALETVRPGDSPAETDEQAGRARLHLLDVITGTAGTRALSPAHLKEAVPGARAPSLDCSPLSGRRGEVPLGSARHFDSYLIVEIAVPWPRAMGRPLSEYPRTPEILRGPLEQASRSAQQDGRTLKPLAIDPDPVWSRPGYVRIMRLDVQPTPRSGYERWEYLVPVEEGPGLLEALYDPDPESRARYRPYQVEDEGVRDLLVCTHGAVDACCGTYGYPMYEALRARLQGAGRTRVWRVSSFGGHRFAPTIVDLPEGRYWGNVTEGHLDDLVHRDGATSAVADIYRGSGAWSHPIAQVAEAALFQRFGWDWTTRTLDLESLDAGDDEKHAALLATVSSTDTTDACQFVIDVDLVDDIDVTIGCTGLHGRVPVYEATRISEVGPRATTDARSLDLETSAHGARAGEAPH